MTVENPLAVIAVDVQNDFCPEGKLAVSEGDQVVFPLNRLFTAANKAGMLTVATRDWHPQEAEHFAGFGGIWPEHCVIGTDGAKFHPDLQIDPVTLIVSKGVNGKDAYSGFEGTITYSPDRNDLGTSLDEALKARGVNRLLVGGLATDYCVKQTCLNAVELGYEVNLVQEAVRAVDINEGDGQEALAKMQDRGVRVISLERALDLIAQAR